MLPPLLYIRLAQPTGFLMLHMTLQKPEGSGDLILGGRIALKLIGASHVEIVFAATAITASLPTASHHREGVFTAPLGVVGCSARRISTGSLTHRKIRRSALFTAPCTPTLPHRSRPVEATGTERENRTHNKQNPNPLLQQTHFHLLLTPIPKVLCLVLSESKSPEVTMVKAICPKNKEAI